MAVRPFYLKSRIDGRSTMLAGGPAAKDGTMHSTVLQRDEGGISELLDIKTHSEIIDGKRTLTTEVIDLETEKIIYSKTTNY